MMKAITSTPKTRKIRNDFSYDHSKISLNIKRLMHINKVSEATLSRNTGIPQTTLNRILLKNADPKTSTIMPICNFFGVSLEEISAPTHEKNHELNDISIKGYAPIIPLDLINSWVFLRKSINPYSYKFIATSYTISSDSFAIGTTANFKQIFRENSYLIIDPKRKPKQENYILVLDKKNNLSIKLVCLDNKNFFLKNPINIKSKDKAPLSTYNIVGPVVECRMDFIK